MELVQLRYFIAAAQLQNISKAARVLNISQPALSKSIFKLEEELGARLFDRSGKKVTLNERGKLFLERAVNSIQELELAASSVKNLLISNHALYLGLFHYCEKFMSCLHEFSQQHPHVVFHLERLGIESSDVDTNAFDMLLFPKSPLFRKYRGDLVYTDPYYMAVHRSDPLAASISVCLSQLPAQRIIFIRHGNAVFDLPYQLCLSLDVNLSDAVFTNSYEIQRWLVSNGLGIGFVPQSSAGAYAVDPDIALLPVRDEELYQEILIGFRREKHLSPAGRSFSSFVREYFGISRRERSDAAEPGI